MCLYSESDILVPYSLNSYGIFDLRRNPEKIVLQLHMRITILNTGCVIVEWRSVQKWILTGFKLCVVFLNLWNLPYLVKAVSLNIVLNSFIRTIKTCIRHFKILSEIVYLFLLYFEMILWLEWKWLLKITQMTLVHC